MMVYAIIDHGLWLPYTPDPLPSWAKRAGNVVVFLERADGTDFYDFRNANDTFTEGSILATTLRDPDNGLEVVKSVFRDETMVFPINQRLIEIIGVDPDETKPHNLFTEKVYDPAIRTLSDPPAPQKPETTVATSQAKIQLSRMKRGDTNLYAMTADLVAKSGDLELQIWWSEAKTWRPSNPNVQKIGGAFNLKPEEIQAAFDAASKITE